MRNARHARANHRLPNLSTREGAAIRAAAARSVTAVAVRGRRLEDAIAAFAKDVPRPATQSIAFGTVRWYFELDACLAGILDRPDMKLDPDVRALMLVGLFQLLHGATPEHAAVSETVEAARALGQPRAAGLVNAILRRFQREREALVTRAHQSAPRATRTPSGCSMPSRATGAIARNRSPRRAISNRPCGCA